jgi:hypothetical protein
VALAGTVLALLGYGAAGAETGTSGQQPREPGLDGPVSLGVSGGIAGIDEGIEVSPAGEVHLWDGDEQRPAGELTDSELAELAERVAEVDLATVPPYNVDENAADLFRFRLEYEGDWVVTDLTEDLGPVDDVISLLDDYRHDRG